MNIAILVWGSLFWDPRNLETTGEWFYDGPFLPIEFARISNAGRLTLVITPGYNSVPTLYTISSGKTLEQAIDNLRIREDSPSTDNIGHFDFNNNIFSARPANRFMQVILIQWNELKGFDAVIWSDFSPRFKNVTEKPLSVENTISYLDALPEATRQLALKYIKMAPLQIATRMRRPIEEYFGIIH